MNLNIDEAILNSFKGKDIKVYFYESGCEGTKINLTGEFDKIGLEEININGANIFFETKDKNKLDNGKIILKLNNKEHTSKYKEKEELNEKETLEKSKGSSKTYLFISPKITSRCGCSSSFSFESKLITKEKLKTLSKIYIKK